MDLLSVIIVVMGVIVSGFVTINFLVETFRKYEYISEPGFLRRPGSFFSGALDNPLPEFYNSLGYKRFERRSLLWSRQIPGCFPTDS